jgi:hypothetical protein
VQETYSQSEVCPGICTPREAYNNDDPLTRKFKDYVYDEKGFITCGFCGRPWRGMLKRCPECGGYFKGPKPYRPMKFALECEACE